MRKIMSAKLLTGEDIICVLDLDQTTDRAPLIHPIVIKRVYNPASELWTIHYHDWFSYTKYETQVRMFAIPYMMLVIAEEASERIKTLYTEWLADEGVDINVLLSSGIESSYQYPTPQPEANNALVDYIDEDIEKKIKSALPVHSKSTLKN